MENIEILNALKGEKLTDDSIESYGSLGIIKEIAHRENCYGDGTAELMAEITGNKVIFNNFVILASACAMSHGYAYLCDEKTSVSPHWDARKRDSQEFCHRYFGTFKRIYEKASNTELGFRKVPAYEYFVYDSKLNRRSPLYKEIREFDNVHPTIQQKLISLFCRTMAAGGIEPIVFNDIRFRMI